MNANTLKAAVKRHAANPTKEAILADEKNFTEDEANEILAAIAKEPKIDLSDFDYSNLEGKSFEDYQEIVGKLFLDEKYDFEEWNAIAVTEFEFDRKTGNKTQIITGIKLMGNKPVMNTRITLRQALEINRHVTTVATDRNSKYLLLKK